MQSWAEKQLADLRETYGGCWDVWYVSAFPQAGYTWHARPAGTPAATVNADSPEELAGKLRTLMCQCPAHAREN